MTSASYYEEKCRSCHGQTKTIKTCPVDAKQGCVSCHMPKADIGVPHSVFTDHHIRVHPQRDGKDGS